MSFTVRVAAIAAVAALAGCATPYQQMGLLGGVSATQIDGSTIRITGRGNAVTDAAQINNYVLLRAAEETLARGYDLFQVVSDRDATRHEVFNLTTTTSQPVFGVTPGGMPVSGFARETENTPIAYTKPGEDIMVRMYHGAMPSPAPTDVYSAREVIAYLGPQVQRHGQQIAAPAGLSPTAPAVLPAAQPEPSGDQSEVIARRF